MNYEDEINELKRQLEKIKFDIRALKEQQTNTKSELRQLDERVDTVFSWPWKRFWWVLRGFRPYKVGRWYGKTKDLK